MTSEPLPAALAWFSRPAAADEQEERQGAGGAAAEGAADETEAEIIQLLKRAKVRRPLRAGPVRWPCGYAALAPASRTLDGGLRG